MERGLTKKEMREAKRQRKLQTREEKQKRARTQRVALWSGAIGVLVLAFAAIVLSSFTHGGSGAADVPTLLGAVTENDHIKGDERADESAVVTLLEYSDFQCSACRTFAPIVSELSKTFTDSFRVVYRHFPLPQHGLAPLAATAAEAAGLQGKFWEMHDMIFEHQPVWSTDNTNATENLFVGYAEQLGLDIALFETDMDSDAVSEKIRRDKESGNQIEINNTPTFFVDGKLITNPSSFEDFRDIIQTELDKLDKQETPTVQAFDASGKPVDVKIETSPVIAP